MITKARVSGDLVGPDPYHAHWVCDAVEFDPDRTGESIRPTDSTMLAGFEEPVDQQSWVSTQGGQESITYSNRKLHNTCIHGRTKIFTYDSSYPVVFKSQDTASPSWSIHGRLLNLPALCGFYSRGIRGLSELGTLEDYQVPWGEYWRQDYSGRAVRTMWPGVQAGNLSTINFVLELKDFKRSYASAKKVYGRLLGISRLVRMMRKKGTSRKERLALAKRASKTLKFDELVAEANLEYAFAYAPFVADCQNIWKGLQGISAECDRIRAHCGRWLTSHYAEGIPAPAPVTASVDRLYAYGLNASQNSFRVMRTVETKESKYHATMDYTYGLRPEEAWVLKWRVTLDRLGINLDPAIAWNAYPWTFVVDWAVRVGDFLHQFRINNVSPIVNILGYCHSVKHERTVTLHVVQGAGSSHSVGEDIPAAQQSDVAYIREPHAPNYYSALQLSGISLREFSLAASLLRVRKHKRTFA